jgi:predicted ATP-grasp superfamily ATP-dependent carboligase
MIWIVGRGIYALNYIRFLGRRVNLITTDKNDFAGLSKYVKNMYYVKFDDNYCLIIEQLVKDHIVVAIGEETLYLDEYIKKTGSNMKLLGRNYNTSSQEIRLMYHNKENFMNLISRLGLPHLETWNSGQIVESYKSSNFLLKLKKSRGGIGQQIIKIQSEYVVPDNWILQPYIKTKRDYSTFVIAKRGHIQHYVAYECIDMIDGYSTQRVKVDIGDLYFQTNQIVKSLKYTGFLGIDFIEFDGTNYMVDFNPRITNGISLLNKNISISTIPYILQKFSLERILKSILYSDIITIFDIMPFIYMIITLVRLLFLSLVNLTKPSVYIRKCIEESVVKYD